MSRAQRRDAARSEKFFFRKNLYREGTSGYSSSNASSGSCTPCNGAPRTKDKKMRNCFPSAPLPENGIHREPVQDEYREMNMNEIMNGDVLICVFLIGEKLTPLPRAKHSQGCLASFPTMWILSRSTNVLWLRLTNTST